MRRQRSVTPLVALLGFEVAAIVGLQALGSAPSMSVPWGDLSTWFSTTSSEQLAASLVRLFALGLAYWMFVSTALFVLAQVSRVPAAIRATSMLTLPSVRRVVDGAMAVSIVTTSLVGLGGPVMAQSIAVDDITTNIPVIGDNLSVPTPRPGAPVQAVTNEPVVGITEDVEEVETAVEEDVVETVDTTPSPSSTEAPTTTSTEAPSTTSTTQAPTTTSAAPTPSISGSAGGGSVPTPRPGARIVRPAEPAAPVVAPAPAPTPVVEAPVSEGSAEVLGASEHRVVVGDNLWTIARDHVAASSNRSAADVSEGEIRDYWMLLVETNRDNMRSQDPHWIFPGEVVNLPPIATPAAAQ